MLTGHDSHEVNDNGIAAAVQPFAAQAADLVRTEDLAWRQRAAKVIPGGMYGHVRSTVMPDAYPQFMNRSAGAKVWDIDGNEYVDLMCAWGPMILGYGHPKVDEAFAKQLAQGDIADGPSPRMVELAERFVDVVAHADWAIFGKNGTDVTTTALTVARAATGKKKILKAAVAYHGSIPWCTPTPAGVTPEDRAHLIEFVYNDIESFAAAVAQAGDDLAGAILAPHRHDILTDQLPIVPEFARAVRRICDEKGAVLILDDVRSGFRVDVHGSWEPIGVRPDLTAFSKCIANGYPLSALTGISSLADAMSSVYVTGSFWYGAAAMAAGIACLDTMIETNAQAAIIARGEQLQAGLREQVTRHRLPAVVSGPAGMPFVRFDVEDPMSLAYPWSNELIRRGVYVHPFHNWFLSSAHTVLDIDRALEASDAAFALVASRL